MTAKRIKLSPAQRAKVLQKTGGLCYLCQEPIDPALPKTSTRHYQVDHMDALANGGVDHMDNYWPAHADCNNAKADFPVAVARRKAAEKKFTSRPW